MKKIYASIDIGSDSTKFVVGEIYKDKFLVLASHSIKSKGIRKGLIVDSNLASTMIKDGMREINNMLGIEVKKVLVSIPNYDVKFMLVTGSLDIKNDGNVVTNDDVNRVIKNSVYNKVDSDYELVTVVPVSFILDGEEVLGKPVGKTAQKLEIKGIMISAPKKNIYSVLNMMEEAGLEVVDIVLSGMSDYSEVRTNSLDEKVGAIINLGHEVTSLSVYNTGKLMNTRSIQMGGINVEKDIAYVFGVNIFDARVLKEKFASCHKRFCQLNEVYEVKNTLGDFVRLNQLEVSEVAMSRVSEILNLCKKELLQMTKHEIKYLVFTGGFTEMKSFKNLVYDIFGKDVIIYTVNTLGARDNKFVSSIGMIKYFKEKMEIRGSDYSMVSLAQEEQLNSSDNNMKDNTIITKIFGNFIGNKEDK